MVLFSEEISVIKKGANKHARTFDGFSERLDIWLASLAWRSFPHPSLLLEGNLDEDAVNHGKQPLALTHTNDTVTNQPDVHVSGLRGGGEAGGEKPTQARWANAQKKTKPGCTQGVFLSPPSQKHIFSFPSSFPPV